MNRVLVLDDDRAVLNCFHVVLAQTRRFEVELLADSTKAFKALEDGRFDLLLLDMDMPVVSGREVLRHVRAHHPEVEVLVITGVGDVELAVESMKLGARDYLCKPVDGARLVACLDRALAARRADAAAQQAERDRRPPTPRLPVGAREGSWHRFTAPRL